MSTKTPLKRIPVSVRVLGLVSMLMDISSEMIHSLLPLFLVGTLGARPLMVGQIEGLAADAAPVDLSGTAYGFFNLVSGIAMLMASAAAGLLWDRFGAFFTFYAGATFAALALMGLVLEVWRQRRLSEEPR